MTIEPTYISQWSTEADRRRNDCGETCVAMWLRALGDATRVNDLPSVDPTGLTTAVDLIQLFQSHGVTASIQYNDPNSDLSTIPLYAICLINYAPIARYSQDTLFGGWHWLIWVGMDKDHADFCFVLDPDYYRDRINEGNHKRLPAAAFRAAFRAYPGISKAQMVIVDPTPIRPPAELPVPMRVEGTSPYWLNARIEPRVVAKVTGRYHDGDVVYVKGRSVADRHVWAQVYESSGIAVSPPQWIAREYLIEVNNG